MDGIDGRLPADKLPFDWKFTRTDLDALLDRIDAHQTQRSLQPAA
jgi:hypothetical protein